VLIAILSERNMDTITTGGSSGASMDSPQGRFRGTFYRRWNGELRKRLSGSVVEWSALGLVVAFVSAAGTTLLSIAAPYVFALVVLVFAFEAGTASAILKLRCRFFWERSRTPST